MSLKQSSCVLMKEMYPSHGRTTTNRYKRQFFSFFLSSRDDMEKNHRLVQSSCGASGRQKKRNFQPLNLRPRLCSLWFKAEDPGFEPDGCSSSSSGLKPDPPSRAEERREERKVRSGWDFLSSFCHPDTFSISFLVSHEDNT